MLHLKKRTWRPSGRWLVQKLDGIPDNCQFYGRKITKYHYPVNMNIYIYISADPGLHQGRGGAWDHRRCGTCFVTMALTLSRVLPCTPLRSLSFRKPSQGKLNTAFGTPFASLSKATLLAPLATFQGNTALRKLFQAKNTTAICFYGRSRLPQTSQTFQTLRKPFQGNPPSRPLAPLGSQPPRPSVFKGVQGCRLPGLKPLKPSKPSASLSKATLQAGPLHLLAARHHGHLF